MKRNLTYLLLILMCLAFVNCKESIRPAESLSETPSQFLELNDSLKIHYKVKEPANADSCKLTLCFVHGFGCDINTWEKQFEALRNEPDMRLVFIDLPGYGESSKPHTDYTLAFYAKAVSAVLNQFPAGKEVLIGHSLGTPVCRQVVMTTPHNAALVDVDGVYCFYDGCTPEYEEAVQMFGHAFDGPGCQEMIAGFVQSLAGPTTPKDITNYAMRTMPATPEYVASSTMQNLIDRKWWDGTQYANPTMVICTQNSGLDPDNRQKMEQLYPTLDYTELTTCGHFIHIEEAEMFNDKLKAFVSQIK